MFFGYHGYQTKIAIVTEYMKTISELNRIITGKNYLYIRNFTVAFVLQVFCLDFYGQILLQLREKVL